MEQELRRLRDCALKRDRYAAAAAQADADARRVADEARRKGAPEEAIEHAFAGKPMPRLVRAGEFAASEGRSAVKAARDTGRQPPPPRVDLEREGWWGGDEEVGVATGRFARRTSQVR